MFFHVLGALGLILLVAVAALTWRLSQGPLRLDVLTPYIADALNIGNGDYRVEVGETRLYWESFDQLMEIRVEDVRTFDRADALVAAVPELALTLAPGALLRGQVRVTSVDMLNPYLQLLRDEDGSLRLGLWYSPDAAASEAVPVDLPERMDGTAILRLVVAGLTGRGDLGEASDLTAVRVVGAQASVIDRRLHAAWTVPDASIELYRGKSGSVGVSATLEVTLSDQDDDTARLDLVGDYDPDSQMVNLGVGFHGLRPAALAPVSDDLAPLAAADLPLDGTVTLTLAVTHTLELRAAGISVTGGAGVLRLPAPVATDYAIDGLSLAGSLAVEPGEIVVDSLSIDLPAPDGVEGVSDPTRLTLTASVSNGTAPGDGVTGTAPGDGVTGTATVTAANVPADALSVWWPEGVAQNPRRWVVANLSGGRLIDGQWAFAFAGPGIDRLEPTKINGRARVEGMRVRYMDDMPPVEGAAADLTFHQTRLDISATAGRLRGLRVTGGDIALTDLDHPTTPMAAIDLRIAGPLTDALSVIDEKPLGYASKLGIRPADVSGTAETRLQLAFPLINDLRLKTLRILATGDVKDAVLKAAVFGQDLSQGNISLRVDTDALEAEGQAVIAGIPAGFTWREYFAGKPFRSRYVVRARVAEDKRAVFGLDFPPLTGPYVRGPADVDLEYTIYDDSLSTVGAQVDLAATRLRVPGFDWVKPVGRPAQATVALRLADGVVRDVSRFSVRSGDDFLAEGTMRLSDGHLDTVTLSTLSIGETALKGTLTARADGGFDVDVRGHAFDATPFLHGSGSGPDISDAAGGDAAGTDDDLPPVDLTAAFDVVWLSEDGTVENVRARMRRLNGHLTQAAVHGLLEGREPVTFTLGGEPGRVARDFSAKTADAGALMQALGLIGTMRGGDLDLNGRILDGGRTEGVLRISDYRLLDAPVLARLLSVAALTGILDALTGEGLAFSTLEVPFVHEGDVLTVKDFRTSGPSLGLTGDGTVDLRSERVALRGTIVPAYAINSLVGKLPLVGGLLSGFEAGGGLFAATYDVTGPIDNPSVSVNPLSALAPGFLRGLFGAGAGDAEVPVPAERPPAGETVPGAD